MFLGDERSPSRYRALHEMNSLSPATLREIARSFAMTLKFLPRKQRPAVTMAYILARLADTLCDSGRASREERIDALSQWQAALFNRSIHFRAPQWTAIGAGETRLLSHAHLLLHSWNTMSDEEREPVVRVLTKLLAAMDWDLKRFSCDFEDAPEITLEEFEWYCAHIAGCVGEFWVDIFKLDRNLIPTAISYGKALQRINILRDIGGDRERGRWYLPFPKSREPAAHQDWPAFLKRYCEETLEGLKAGESFCNHVSRFSPRLRFASYLPAAIGVETLRILSETNRGEKPHKISQKILRNVVWEALWRSGLAFHFSRCQRTHLGLI